MRIVLPFMVYLSLALLSLIISNGSRIPVNPLRLDLFRTAHSNAGVLLVMSFLIIKQADVAELSAYMKRVVKNGAALSAILIPSAFILSALNGNSDKPNFLIYFALLGFVILAFTLVMLGIGLARNSKD